MLRNNNFLVSPPSIAGVSKHYRTVVVTYSAKGSISNENSDKYPYFFRTVASNKHNKYKSTHIKISAALNKFRYAFTELIRCLGWTKVAAITQDGQKYSDYMSTLQDTLQQQNINFVLNRKFPPNAPDLSLVKRITSIFSDPTSNAFST